MTADAFEEEKKKTLEAGMNYHLSKPINPKTLYNILSNHLCEFPYKSRVMPTSEPLKTLKAPYMARNTMKWGFFRLKSQ